MRAAGPAVLLTLATACAAAGAPRPKDARKPTDPPAGDWEVHKTEEDGRVTYEYKGDRRPFKASRFAPKKWVLLFGKVPAEERAEYYRNGEVFEIDLSPGDPKGVMRGIWKVDGDTLLLCVGKRGADRPTEFTAPKGSGRALWTLKRKGKD